LSDLSKTAHPFWQSAIRAGILLAVSKEELIETTTTEPDETLVIIEAPFMLLADVIDQLNDMRVK
jgi:hypothetical protein